MIILRKTATPLLKRFSNVLFNHWFDMLLKVITIFLVIAGALSYSFQEYIFQFQKVYDSQEEKEFRSQIFLKRIKEYEELNSQKLGYSVGPTKWTDRTDEEIKESLTVKSTAKNETNGPIRISAGLFDSAPVEGTVDWRENGAITSAKDQGGCGSCWAFSSIASYESLLVMTDNLYTDLSEQYSLECTDIKNTCKGGYLHQTIQKLIKSGAPLQTAYPYTGAYSSSSITGQGICKAGSRIKNSNELEQNIFYSITNNQLLSLLNDGPLTTAIIGGDAGFLGYKSGVFSCTKPYTYSMINHAIQIVGYNNVDRYYIIKNSWGTKWGMNGFAYISMDNDCMLVAEVHQIKVKSSSVVVPTPISPPQAQPQPTPQPQPQPDIQTDPQPDPQPTPTPDIQTDPQPQPPTNDTPVVPPKTPDNTDGNITIDPQNQWSLHPAFLATLSVILISALI